MTSQSWMGREWLHTVTLFIPEGSETSDTAAVYVTGGEPNDADASEAVEIAQRSGRPVALLYHIPNQPIFDRREDDLIAHTFEQFIDTGDTNWPLLYPMTRATIRCLDLLEGFDGMNLKRFVVMGASKRGWTTWLAAATGDPRIVGIAPMVIDNLNFPAQMEHQVQSWGGYSEQIQDYTSRELQEEMDTGRGAELVTMMDPINYVDQIRCPILIVNGANDRYWTVDALSLYWDLLPEPKHCLIVPNAGHLLGDKVKMIESLGAFVSACAHRATLPEVSARHYESGFDMRIDPVATITTWVAVSDSLDFRDSEWQELPMGAPIKVGEKNWAVMLEARFEGSTGEFSLSTPVRVFGKR